MTSNLETIEVSKVRGAAPAPQISAMPSSMAADPTKQEVFRGEKRNKFNKAKVSDWRHTKKTFPCFARFSSEPLRESSTLFSCENPVVLK